MKCSGMVQTMIVMIVDQISAESYDSASTGAAEDYLTFDNLILSMSLAMEHPIFVEAPVGNADDPNGFGYENMIGSVYMLDGSGYTHGMVQYHPAAATIEVMEPLTIFFHVEQPRRHQRRWSHRPCDWWN